MSRSSIDGIFVLAAGLVGAAAVSVAASVKHGAGYDAQAVDLVDLATRYMLVHAAALLGLAGFVARGGQGRRLAIAAGWLFVLGCVLFGGGMILWALTHVVLFDAAIPVGGTSLILGWLALAAAGVARLVRRDGP